MIGKFNLSAFCKNSTAILKKGALGATAFVAMLGVFAPGAGDGESFTDAGIDSEVSSDVVEEEVSSDVTSEEVEEVLDEEIKEVTDEDVSSKIEVEKQRVEVSTYTAHNAEVGYSQSPTNEDEILALIGAGEGDIIMGITDTDGATITWNQKDKLAVGVYVIELKTGSNVTLTVYSEDDVKPTISGANDITIALNQSFDPKDGVTANDDVDGNLTDSIIVSGVVNTGEAGVYTLTYIVSDAASNETSVDRKVTVLDDKVAPVIYGVEDKTVQYGTSFDAMSGVYATDNVSSSENITISVSGTVDTKTVGEKDGSGVNKVYTLTYTAIDEAGNKAEATRKITVLSYANHTADDGAVYRDYYAGSRRTGRRYYYGSDRSSNRTSQFIHYAQNGTTVIKRTYYYDQHGTSKLGARKQISEYYSNGSAKSYTYYNTSGVKTRYNTKHSSSNSQTYKEWTYYSNGKVSKRTTYGTSGKLSEIVTYHSNGKTKVRDTYHNGVRADYKEYYSNGKLSKKYTYYSNGHVKTRHTYRNDSKNTLASYYFRYSNGKTKDNRTYYTNGKWSSRTLYSSNGNRTSHREYYSNGKTKSTYNYYSSGRINERITYNSRGQRTSYYKRYNANYGSSHNGRYARYFHYSSGQITKREYWSSNGKRTDYKTYYSNGKKSSDYSYHSNGAVKEKFTYYSSGRYKQKEYRNSAGKTTQIIKYNSSGKVTSNKKYHVSSTSSTSSSSSNVGNMNSYETQVFNEINAWRKSQGLSALKHSNAVHTAAEAEVKASSASNPHPGAYVSYVKKDFTKWGAIQGSCGSKPTNCSAKSYVNSWANSYGHRIAMESTQFKYMSVAYDGNDIQVIFAA